MKKNLRTASLCVHGGYEAKNGEPIEPPIIQSTTFKYDNSEEMAMLFDLKKEGYFYTRLQNPTNDVVAQKIAQLEGGVGAVLTSSGQAANFYAVFNICEAGDHIVTSNEIYGGTFNPIHKAHVHLVREFIKRLSLDRVILIPTGTPPHKATHQLASGADRIEMCRLAAADIAECPVTVSDIEVLRTGKSYTADTMTELKAQYPDDELFLLMGEDMFCTVEKWYHPERIFAAAEICAAPRDKDSFQTLVTHGEEVKEKFPQLRFTVQNIEFLPVSSTMVREKSLQGEDISSLVPAGVAEYIQKKRLYTHE